MYARYETDLCFIVFYSWEWLRFTVAWLKWKINLKYRAFSKRYITDTMCRERMTRIVSSLSLMTNVCTRERQRARERQWGLGYNAWQIDCLNRIGFNELHRRTFRGQKDTTDGKNVRAPQLKQWKYEDRLYIYTPEKRIFFLPRSKVHTTCDFDSCIELRIL